MVLIQLDLKPELDKKVKLYMINNDIDKKTNAITKLLENTLK